MPETPDMPETPEITGAETLPPIPPRPDLKSGAEIDEEAWDAYDEALMARIAARGASPQTCARIRRLLAATLRSFFDSPMSAWRDCPFAGH